MDEVLYASVMSKAFNLGPSIRRVTLGPAAAVVAEPEEFQPPHPNRASTPKKPGRGLTAFVMRRPKINAAVTSEQHVKEQLLEVQSTKKDQIKAQESIKNIENNAKRNNELMQEAFTQQYINNIYSQAEIVARTEMALIEKFSNQITISQNKDFLQNPKRAENLLKIEEDRQKTLQLEKRVAFIRDWYKNHLRLYAELLKICDSCKDQEALEKKSVTLLKMQREKVSVESLRCKMEQKCVTDDDKLIADRLTKSLRDACDLVRKDVYAVNEEFEKRVKETEKKRIKEENAQKLVESKEQGK